MNINKKIDIFLKEDTNKSLNEMTDEENPEYLFRLTDTSLLIKIATGKLDAKLIAKKEMANRGFDKKGKWIGFEKAKQLWGVK